MPRLHPRLAILALLNRSGRSLPSSSIAGEVGIEPARAVAHLRILRGRGLVIRIAPNSGHHAGEWATTTQTQPQHNTNGEGGSE